MSRSESDTGRLFVDQAPVEKRLGAMADVVEIETGEATRALTDALPGRLDVFGGAMRVWWPGLGPQFDPYQHRLDMPVRPGAGRGGAGSARGRAGAAHPTQEESVATVVVDSLASGIVVREANGANGRVVELHRRKRTLLVPFVGSLLIAPRSGAAPKPGSKSMR